MRSVTAQNKGDRVTEPVILLVDPDAANRRLVREGFLSVLGNFFRYAEAGNVGLANDHIFNQLITTGQLPSLIVSELLVPSKVGELVVYPNEVNQSYPEIPILLHTQVPKDQAIGKVKARVQLMGYLVKPWQPQEHPTQLAQLLAQLVA